MMKEIGKNGFEMTDVSAAASALLSVKDGQAKVRKQKHKGED